MRGFGPAKRTDAPPPIRFPGAAVTDPGAGNQPLTSIRSFTPCTPSTLRAITSACDFLPGIGQLAHVRLLPDPMNAEGCRDRDATVTMLRLEVSRRIQPPRC